MKTKELILGIFRLVYFISLVFIMVMLFICIFTNTNAWIAFAYIFIGVLAVGYLILIILNMITFTYVCPDCHKEKKMNFFETMFSKRGNNVRVLKCPNCGEKKIMPRKEE